MPLRLHPIQMLRSRRYWTSGHTWTLRRRRGKLPILVCVPYARLGMTSTAIFKLRKFIYWMLAPTSPSCSVMLPLSHLSPSPCVPRHKPSLARLLLPVFPLVCAIATTALRIPLLPNASAETAAPAILSRYVLAINPSRAPCRFPGSSPRVCTHTLQPRTVPPT
ncbi:hypothetical protein EI94DRAFT_1739891 [Lactarius quietus]|nr:hypothetical protein EI94DRAFT_1739891 [Lactarius quietus]